MRVTCGSITWPVAVLVALGSMVPPASAGSGGVRDGRGVRVLPGVVWESRGIGGGGAFFSPSPSPHDADRVFVSSDMSGVYETVDLGRSWRMHRADRLRGGVGTELRFTADPEVLYGIDAAGDLRVPVRSSDGGVTWTPLAGDPTGGEACSLWADPASTQRILVSSYDTLFFSGDGGSTFHQVHQAPDEHVAGVFWDGDTILVGARDGLLVSTDGGASFGLSTIGGIPTDGSIVSFAGIRVGEAVRLWAVTLGAGDVWPHVTGSDHCPVGLELR